MIAPLDRSDLERFQAAIARRTGLYLDESKAAHLEEVLLRRVAAEGVSVNAYLSRLANEGPGDPLGALIPELTVGETYFFRHMDQFRAFIDVAVPRALAEGKTRLSFLSAGCSTGEEAYSLAMLAVGQVPSNCELSIRAVDINVASLERAKVGQYSTWALRETPAEMKDRWFRDAGREVILDPSIRARVLFEERNLAVDDADLWPSCAYDVIFCRNTMMYFTPERMRELVARMTRSLVPGGHLFLGHAETLRGISPDYLLRHTHDTFYYERKGALSSQAPLRSTGERGVGAPPAPVIHPDPGWESAWMETVQRASTRIKALTDGPAAQPVEPSAPKSTNARVDLLPALDLLERERFVEALALLHALPIHAARDAEALLLRAALFAHAADLSSAERACQELLAIDDLNAGAHYLLALCRDGAGDRKGAIEHDQIAGHLDPGFAMPRLHHGLLARRAGDRSTARRELGHALSLLQREDPARLLLFGGGFGRESLLAVCRTELAAVGDRP